MAKTTYASMSVSALLKMRDEIGDVLSRKTNELRKQLLVITGETRKPRRSSLMKGKRVAAQFRSKKDPKQKWSGRGGTPRWMKDEMKGTRLKKENFRIK